MKSSWRSHGRIVFSADIFTISFLCVASNEDSDVDIVLIIEKEDKDITNEGIELRMEAHIV